MTEDEAKIEARRRWGKAAQVLCQPSPHFWYPDGRHLVGVIVGAGRPAPFVLVVIGYGGSWEEAFAHADAMQREGTP